MTSFTPPRRDPFTLRITQWLNEKLFFPHRARITSFVFPSSQQRRLQHHLGSHAPTFITPNHPEFMTDWAVDKWLIDHYAPSCLSWAAPFILQGPRWLQRFWLNNGLIAAVKTPANAATQASPTQANPAMAFSIQQAVQGTPILLHPEGAVNWDPHRVSPLRQGTALMALECVQQRPDTAIVPFSTYYRFQHPLHAQHALEKALLRLERRWHLSASSGHTPAERLFALYEHALSRQEHALQATLAQYYPATFTPQTLTSFPSWKQTSGSWSSRVDQWVQSVIAWIVPKLPNGLFLTPPDPSAFTDWTTWIYSSRLLSFVHPEAHPFVQRLVRSFTYIERLMYRQTLSTPTLDLETLASLYQRLRADHFTQSWQDRLHAFMPQALSDRTCFLSMSPPLSVKSWQDQHPHATSADLTDYLHSVLTDHLQQAQHMGTQALGIPKAYSNPFHR